MKEKKISPKLKEIITKFKERMADSDEEFFDRIIEFAYSEGSINGQSELYNTPKSKTNE